MKKGFTLAEVLITLVIIGVIAAMTIPTLMNKTNEQETVTAVKKAYSVLGQAYKKIIAENGEIIPSELGNSQAEATEKMGDMFAKHLSVVKNCGMSAGGDCFADEGYKQFNGSNWGNVNNFTDRYKLRLNDGMSMSVNAWNVSSDWGTSPSLKNSIGFIYFDINGDKAPNVVGKDVFAFYITKDDIIPVGTPYDIYNPLSACKTHGTACTAWVITKGNMDYLRKDVSW